MPPAASRAPCPTVLVTIAVDLVPLPGVDHRAQRDRAAGGVADRQPVGPGGERVDVGVGHARLDQVPAGGHADLALVGERPPRPDRGRGLEVDVVQHQQRGVAAELEVHPLEVLGGEGADRPAGPGRAGEGDHPHGPLHDERLADVGAAGQDVQDPVGQARLGEDLGETAPRR